MIHTKFTFNRSTLMKILCSVIAHAQADGKIRADLSQVYFRIKPIEDIPEKVVFSAYGINPFTACLTDKVVPGKIESGEPVFFYLGISEAKQLVKDLQSLAKSKVVFLDLVLQADADSPSLKFVLDEVFTGYSIENIPVKLVNEENTFWNHTVFEDYVDATIIEINKKSVKTIFESMKTGKLCFQSSEYWGKGQYLYWKFEVISMDIMRMSNKKLDLSVNVPVQVTNLHGTKLIGWFNSKLLTRVLKPYKDGMINLFCLGNEAALKIDNGSDSLLYMKSAVMPVRSPT